MNMSLLFVIATALLHGPARQEAPLSLGLRDLHGRTVTLERYRGHVVVLNFWATWCPPCRAETPDLVALQTRYEAEGLRVIGVTCPPYTRAAVVRFAKRARIPYPILLGTKDISTRVAGTDVLPVTLVLDRDGRVRAKIEGILTPEEIEEKIVPLLEPAPTDYP